MSALVLAAIAADVAALERIVDPPSEPLGYGIDIACDTDLMDNARDVDPFSQEGISQSILRALDCPPGAIYGELEYVSLDLRERLNQGATTDDVGSLALEIQGVVLADDRIEVATVTVDLGDGGASLAITIDVTSADPDRLPPFRLVFVATSTEIVLEQMRATA